MRRRALLCLLGGAATPWPLRAVAQQPGKVARIGYLAANLAASPQQPAAFRQGLRELGWIEGRNIAIEYRDAQGKPERLPALAAELVALRPDVIVAGPTLPAIAASRATGAIPIVFPVASDPIGSGLVASLARPGGNVTGLSLQASELVGKGLQLLVEAVPGAGLIAVLLNPAGHHLAVAELPHSGLAQLDVQLLRHLLRELRVGVAREHHQVVEGHALGLSFRPLLNLAGEEGFEPSNAGIKIQCLNQLGDSPSVPLLLHAQGMPHEPLGDESRHRCG